MEILTVIILLSTGFFVGWKFRERVAVIKAHKLLDELEQEVEQELEQEVVKIIIERDTTGLFAYHKESKQFITQAADRKELERKLAELFPGKTFGVTPQNLIEIGFTS